MRSLNIDYQPRLDHLRLLAALLVFVFHCYHSLYGHWHARPQAWVFGWIIEGHTGVSLFFVLSGYLFMSIAARHSGPLHYWRFLRNRLLRIFPLFLFIFFVAISLSRDAFRAADWGYLLFSNLGKAPTSNHFITGAAWTISIEFTFYLIFPFLARFALERGPFYLVRLVLLLALFKLGAYFAVVRPLHLYYSTLLGRLDQFLIGMAAAFLSLRLEAAERCLGGGWLLASLFLVWGAVACQSRFFSYFDADQHTPFWIFWGSLEAVCWAGLILAYRHWRGHLRPTLSRLLGAGGSLTFSFYLWHALIIFLWQKLVGEVHWTGCWRFDFLLQVLLLAFLSGGVAQLSYRTIEEPFLALRGRY